MYNNPYDYYREQNMSPMNMNQMNMQDMGQQMGNMPDMTQQMHTGGGQQPFFHQMPTMPMHNMPMQGAPMHAMPMQAMPMQPIQPMMPMGTVTGATTSPFGGTQEVQGTTSGTMPTNIASIPLAINQFGATPDTDVLYTQGYLRTQIGRRVKVEFLIGTNMLVDREGTLVDVGISYIIINEVETDDLLLCDIYSIKFVRFYF